jgi:hypothetical protein
LISLRLDEDLEDWKKSQIKSWVRSMTYYEGLEDLIKLPFTRARERGARRVIMERGARKLLGRTKKPLIFYAHAREGQ